jgi:hypothetical protein
MEAIAAYKYSNSSKPHCPGFMGPDFVAMAERELSAFFDAVTQLFGSEQAELSADDWLREFIEIDGLPASPSEWRLITAKVSTRLASRVKVLSQSTEFTSV